MNATEIIQKLESFGYEALYVGGFVRDELLDVPSNDIDIATNAHTDVIIEIFKGIASVDLVGKNFGVVIVNGIEVAMYRSETYENRKPTVKHISNYHDDSARRDFTINSIGKTSDGKIIDHHGGLSDIQNKIIRFVGVPTQRIQEDPSRILRAFYFASRFGFSIDSESLKAIQEQSRLLDMIPNELKGKIIQKVIHHNCLSIFMQMITDNQLLPYILDELSHTLNVPQNPLYHKYDVFNHIIAVIKGAEQRFPSNEIFLLSALLHDCAKGLPHIRGVNKKGQPNDIGHEEESKIISQKVLDRIQINKSTKETILFIINFHGFRLNKNPKRKSIMKVLRKMKVHFKNKKELLTHVNLVFDFMLCDSDGFSDNLQQEVQELVSHLRPLFVEVIEETAFYPNDLEIDGHTIISYGFKGKDVGKVIDNLINLNIWKHNEAIAYLKKKTNTTV